jgi:hypothetical protein
MVSTFAFNASLLSHCHHSINYDPKNTTLYFSASECHPGDYSSSNKNTEALAYCSFGVIGSKVPMLFSEKIGKKLGATVIPDHS